MQYVGVGWRFVAVVIDAITFFILAYLIALVSGNTTESGFEMNGPIVLVPMIIFAIYAIAMEATIGATLGKLALGLRIVKTNGSTPIGWQAAIVRNVLRVVDGLFGYLVGAILVWRSNTRQRLGDRIAGTVVVKKASLVQAAPAA